MRENPQLVFPKSRSHRNVSLANKGPNRGPGVPMQSLCICHGSHISRWVRKEGAYEEAVKGFFHDFVIDLTGSKSVPAGTDGFRRAKI